MKLLSWNVNGIRACARGGFVGWLADQDADVVCIQETKGAPEQLDEDNKWLCDKCEQKTCATKHTSIWKTAEFVVIHLKRFLHVRTPMGYALIKDSHPVIYPLENLDLTPYVEDPNKDGEVYDLCAVALHGGSLRGGHYVCARKIGGSWWLFDDSTVTPVDAKAVVNTAAYYLVYRRK